jgi:hypothetical protein
MTYGKTIILGKYPPCRVAYTPIGLNVLLSVAKFAETNQTFSPHNPFPLNLN